MRKLTFICTLLTVVSGLNLSAQSRSFKLSQWIEIHNAIVKELNTSYVDSIQFDRVMRAGIDAMLEELDPYTIYIPKEENEDFRMSISHSYGGIGAIISKEKDGNVVINEPYKDSPAHKYGLICGDEIVAIDGVPTKGLETKESTDRMKGKPGTTVVFTVKKSRTGDTLDVPVVREKIHMPDVEYAGMLNDTTGYILQTGFSENVSKDIKDNFIELKKQGMKKFILDLRGNGGGILDEAVQIVGLFVPKGTLVVSSKGNNDSKGENTYTEFRTSTNPIDTEIEIVVLINSGSASAAEIVSGALQDMDRAVVMGERSFGKGLVQSVRHLPFLGQLKLTTSKYYTPSGRCVQAIDYSNRNEDGSVGHIPDSLTKEFRTAGGRIVRDGGGITPDITLKSPDYSRLVYSLVLGGTVDKYVLQYCKEHESIPATEDFHYTEQDFEDFIKFAMTQEFDYRSGAQAYYDMMKEELEKDGMVEAMAEPLEAMKKALEIEKADFLRMKMDEIIPFIEEEIVVRYWFQEEGIKVRIRYDKQLEEALETEYDIL